MLSLLGVPEVGIVAAGRQRLVSPVPVASFRMLMAMVLEGPIPQVSR